MSDQNSCNSHHKPEPYMVEASSRQGQIFQVHSSLAQLSEYRSLPIEKQLQFLTTLMPFVLGKVKSNEEVHVRMTEMNKHLFLLEELDREAWEEDMFDDECPF